MSRSEELMAQLRRGEVLVADGACGTMLQAKGLDTGKVPESWLFEQPEQVRALHRAYAEAGADVILTCTFGGTRFRLPAETAWAATAKGHDDRVAKVNRRAAELAAEAAGEGVFLAGDMGPTGELLVPLGRLSEEEVSEAYAEQAAALAEGGVDLILIETMSDLGEARAAIRGVREATDLPVFCTFSFDTRGRTMMGVRPAQAAREIGPLVEGIGANCGHDPAEYMEVMAAMREAAPGAILWAKPNAGLPRLVEDEVIYEATPGEMGKVARRLVEEGVQIVGGCCGTTPAHIGAMVRAVRRYE